ncbi:MAG: hypothetical protein MZV63_28770 [Marinilabiliales bacterium]|nr:hypothetical protein [Marinilabiliales bacterium]
MSVARSTPAGRLRQSGPLLSKRPQPITALILKRPAHAFKALLLRKCIRRFMLRQQQRARCASTSASRQMKLLNRVIRLCAIALSSICRSQSSSSARTHNRAARENSAARN